MLTAQEVHKFWSRVDVRGPDECWPWLAGQNGERYGVFSVSSCKKRKQMMATHVSIFLDRGEVCPGRHTYALHSCDNPPCVNPKHLRFSTPKANSADAKERGRASPPPVVRDNPEWEAKRVKAMPRGEKNPMAHYTEVQVRDICMRLKEGASPLYLAEELGIAVTLVRDLKYGKAWKHIAAEYMPFPRLPNHKPKSRMSIDAIAEMRRLYAAGVPAPELGRRFGVSRHQAWKLCTQ